MNEQQQLQQENLTLKRVIGKLSQKIADLETDLSLAEVMLEDRELTIKKLNEIVAEQLEQ